MKGDEIAGDLALEKVDLLLKVLGHPQGVGGRLICDLPESTEPRVGFFALVLRDLDDRFDAIPAKGAQMEKLFVGDGEVKVEGDVIAPRSSAPAAASP